MKRQNLFHWLVHFVNFCKTSQSPRCNFCCSESVAHSFTYQIWLPRFLQATVFFSLIQFCYCSQFPFVYHADNWVHQRDFADNLLSSLRKCHSICQTHSQKLVLQLYLATAINRIRLPKTLN